MRGYLYVLSNAAFPGLLKIGRTNEHPDDRARALNTTGVPGNLILEFCFLVPGVEAVEREVHAALKAARHSKNREYFSLPVEKALDEIVPIVRAALEGSAAASAQSSAPRHDLPREEVLLLQLLAKQGTTVGMAQWQLVEYLDMKELDLEVAIADLAARKLVSRDRKNPEMTVWRCTPRGVKFLADHNLVEEWMYQR